MYTWDEQAFLALNFDGGEFVDTLMELISGKLIWIPWYLLIGYLVWKKYGLRSLLTFVVCMALALGLADMLCGIFKHTGLLKGLWPSFPARQRPMFTPEINELCHIPSFAHGPYGTVSAHAATMFALAVFSALTIGKRWYTYLALCITLLICYSRIYLACHYPMDLILGSAVGIVTAFAMFFLWKKLDRTIEIYHK